MVKLNQTIELNICNFKFKIRGMEGKKRKFIGLATDLDYFLFGPDDLLINNMVTVVTHYHHRHVTSV